jgi:hypothetical protein
MRHALFVVVALALPLAAQETQPVQPADSPLVAAAKRMNRKGKKPSHVITNDTLRQAGASSTAHVTTTTNQGTLKMPPPVEPPRPTPEMEAQAARIAREKEAAEQAALQKKAREAAELKARRTAEAAEEGYDGSRDDADEFVGSPPQL